MIRPSLKEDQFVNLLLEPCRLLDQDANNNPPLETQIFSIAEFGRIDLANAYRFYLGDILIKEPGLNRDMIVQNLHIREKFALNLVIQIVQ